MNKSVKNRKSKYGKTIKEKKVKNQKYCIKLSTQYNIWVKSNYSGENEPFVNHITFSL